jgi:hypothetical protein
MYTMGLLIVLNLNIRFHRRVIYSLVWNVCLLFYVYMIIKYGKLLYINKI